MASTPGFSPTPVRGSSASLGRIRLLRDLVNCNSQVVTSPAAQPDEAKGPGSEEGALSSLWAVSTRGIQPGLPTSWPSKGFPLFILGTRMDGWTEG